MSLDNLIWAEKCYVIRDYANMAAKPTGAQLVDKGKIKIRFSLRAGSLFIPVLCASRHPQRTIGHSRLNVAFCRGTELETLPGLV